MSSFVTNELIRLKQWFLTGWARLSRGRQYILSEVQAQHRKFLNGRVFRPVNLFKVRGLETGDNNLREAW